MSLKRNITASFVSQIYIALAGILVIPVYIKQMGPEAYGLVGFFAMLQAWFNILDMGLTPTIGRETARYFSGTTSALTFRKLFRALHSIFIFVAIFGALALTLSAGSISEHWLNAQLLSGEETQASIKIMAVIIALRWTTGLYRGVISGAEKIVWLSYFNIIVASSRFILVIPVMHALGYTPSVFFTYQLGVALIEASVLFLKSGTILPRAVELPEKIGWSLQPVLPALKFSLSIAALTVIWIAVTQADKLLLSSILPLADYGYFTLAVLVASSVTLISSPISSALLPRMTRLHAEGFETKMLNTYLHATQLVSATACSAAVMIACSAEQLIYAWTGEALLAEQSAQVLRLYAIGNGLLAVGAFPYYLQYAHGNLRYHLIGNIGLLILIVPAFVWVATHYGGVGAGYVWVAAQTIYLLIWVPYVHSKIAPGFHRRWLAQGVIRPLIPFAAFAILLATLNPENASRLGALTYLLFVGTVSAAIFFASRKFLFKYDTANGTINRI